MGIFGRKKIKKIDKREFKPPVDIEKIKPPLRAPKASNAPNITNYPQMRQPKSFPKADDRTDEKSNTFAPVFIKLTRYKQILNSMNYIKMSLNLIRNQIAILNELEKLRADNMKLLQSTFEKVNDKLIKLDSQFMRPSGFMEDMPEMQMHEMESLDNTITDLKAQVEGLKQEVDSLA